MACGLTCETATVLANDQVGPRLWLMQLRSPELAQRIAPGQFSHLKVPGMEDHILRRPFSIYDTNPKEGTIDILYQTVGYGSKKLTHAKAGATLDHIGPVGHGWTIPSAEDGPVLVVGGGVGAAPLYLLVQTAVAAGVDVQVILGAQTKDALVTRARYTTLLGAEPTCATDDGSYGYAGFATEPVRFALLQRSFSKVYVCGPEPLMKIVAGLAEQAHVPCEVSMERRMACGIGACLSCVVDTTTGKRRACVDGPVFSANEVVW